MADTSDLQQLILEQREEIDKLHGELDQANQERAQAAECGLAVLEEKQQLQQNYDDLERELECAKEVRN